jgi:hypothetical protein
MKDDDINVEMIWEGKDTASAWVCFACLLGVVTASDFRIFFFTDRRRTTLVPGDGLAYSL